MRDAAGFRVSALEPQHRDAWAPLWARYLALLGYGDSSAPRDVWSRLVAGGETGALGAWVGAELVGFLHYARHAHPWTERRAWLIADVFTDERARGRGAARALLDEAFSLAAAEGAAWAWGGVGVHNAAARAAYAELADDVGQTVFRRVL